MYKKLGISDELLYLANLTENELERVFKEIDEIKMYNSQKVLLAFQNNNVSDMHFGTSTGYGHNDVRKRLYWKNFFRNTWRRR